MGYQVWTFRGDDELDPVLSSMRMKNERSFHIRQALRQYFFGARLAQQSTVGFDLRDIPKKDLEIEEDLEIELTDFGDCPFDLRRS